jgi:tetratricopeptide (TPR) repeat protein
MPPAVGTRFGRYELLEKLGAGAMGEVYRARDHDLHRDVAVKFLPEQFSSDAERLARFAQEARAVSSLSHPNIVTIHEIGKTEGMPYIVMELVQGETLRDQITGRLPARRFFGIATQLAEGLAKAHAAGIVHRDIKPSNVMITQDGFVKILDFGLAKLREEGAPEGEVDSGSRLSTLPHGPPSPQTAAGTVLGTTGYMSPEQVRGRSVDFRSDQFALGVILYEMATGRHPFLRETTVETLAAILDVQPSPVAELNPALPAPLSWIVDRCLAKQPADRYASTVDLARELRVLREHLGAESAPPTLAGPAPPPRPSRVRRRALVAAAAAAVLVFIPVAIPGVRERAAVTLHLRPIPEEKRLAILPFRAASTSQEDRALADGISDHLTVRLTQMERFQKTLAVESTSNVRRSGITSADMAAKALGVNLVVSGSIQRPGAALLFMATLEDAQRGRTLRAESADSLEDLLQKVVRMLDLHLDSEARVELRASGTGVAEAAVLSAQALGFTPYAEGRTALERYDQSRSLERAIELFNKALERDPKYALAHAGLGEAYWRLYANEKRPELVALAREHCERALALDSLLAPAWITLGVIETGTGNAEKAIAAFRRALDRDPRSASARRELGNAYAKLGRFEDAEATYKKAIELRPEDWANDNHLGSFLYARARFTDAEAEFRRALQIAPDNARVWSNLGAALNAQDRVAEAQAAFARSIALNPSPQAISNLGATQFYAGRYAEAVRTYETATRAGTRDYRVWRNYAAALHWTPGEREREAPAYRKAAELAEEERKLDPKNARTLVELADCRAMLGEPDRARTLAAEGLRMAPGDGTVARIAAGVYEVIGDRAEALGCLGKALEAGYNAGEIGRDPTFTSLRGDRRWVAMTAGKAAPR